MATTTLQTPAETDLDLTLHTLSGVYSNFALVAHSDNGNTQQATYRYAAGSAEDALSLQARRSYNSGLGRTFCSMTLSALQKHTDDASEVTYKPLNLTIKWDYEGEVCLDTDHIVDMMSYTFGMLSQTLSGANGYPTAAEADKFNLSVLTTLVS